MDFFNQQFFDMNLLSTKVSNESVYPDSLVYDICFKYV